MTKNYIVASLRAAVGTSNVIRPDACTRLQLGFSCSTCILLLVQVLVPCFVGTAHMAYDVDSMTIYGQSPPILVPLTSHFSTFQRYCWHGDEIFDAWHNPSDHTLHTVGRGLSSGSTVDCPLGPKAVQQDENLAKARG